MTNLLFVALGGAIGGAVAIAWLAQSESHWRRRARVSVMCGLLGAFFAVVPHPSGAVAVFLGYGVLVTLGTPISLILPLPQLAHSSDVWQLAKSMSFSLAVVTFYGGVSALIGNMAMQAMFQSLM
jgi:hypothetical protein